MLMRVQEKMCVRKVIFGILPHAVVKMVDMQEALLTVQLYVIKLFKNNKMNCDKNCIPTNFNKKKVTSEMKNFYIILAFIITITLLIAVSIYCCIKYRTKQNHLLPFHGTNIKF